MTLAGDERRYVRAIEAAWSKLLGRPALVSPREFETVDAWRRRGIPLTVVLEVIAAAGKRRSGGAPKALTALAHAVEDAWSVVAAGRATTGAVDGLPDRGSARRAWEEALARCPDGTPLRGLLSLLLDDERRGVAAAVLDQALDSALPGVVAEGVLTRATDETARELASFKPRMSDDEFRKTSARALSDRLRSELALPRLSLSR